MSKYITIKKLLFISLAAVSLTACGGGSNSNYGASGNSYTTSDGEEIILGSENPICKKGNAKHAGQVMDSYTSKGVNNVTVTIAGCTTKTDSNGFYTFKNIVSSTRTSVVFEKDTYSKNSAIITIDNDTSNYLKLSLEKTKSSWIYNREEGIEGIHINLDASTHFTDIYNKKYDGNITASLTYNDPMTEEGRNTFPGSYQGIDSNNIVVSFIAYGFINIQLKDTIGNNLKISENIKITFDHSQELENDTIPLWSYNYNMGIWVERGVAHKDENGNFSADVSHLGTWCIAQGIETESGIYTGRIVDTEGDPIPNIRVSALGKGWIVQDLTTDENGIFTLNVIPNKTFNLRAYNYKEKFGATYRNTLDAIAPGEIVDNKL